MNRREFFGALAGGILLPAPRGQGRMLWAWDPSRRTYVSGAGDVVPEVALATAPKLWFADGSQFVARRGRVVELVGHRYRVPSEVPRA